MDQQLITRLIDYDSFDGLEEKVLCACERNANESATVMDLFTSQSLCPTDSVANICKLANGPEECRKREKTYCSTKHIDSMKLKKNLSLSLKIIMHPITTSKCEKTSRICKMRYSFKNKINSNTVRSVRS